MTEPERRYRFDRKFTKSIKALELREREQVHDSIAKYGDPVNWKSLNKERISGTGRLWTIRASDELRVLLAREGSITVFLRAGHHDDIYKMALNVHYVVPKVGDPRLVPFRRNISDIDGSKLEGPEPDRTRRKLAEETPSVLVHWEYSDLIAAGLDKAQVVCLRSTTADTICDIWPEDDEEGLLRIFDLDEQTPEEWRTGQLFDASEVRKERFRAAIVERGAVAGLSALLTDAELQKLTMAPIEDWMIFLHPDQTELVHRRFNGPAWLRGSAGTGKTSVVLHRAAALAQRFAKESTSKPLPILLTTFTTSLSTLLSELYERLPNALPGVVKFLNIDKVARGICSEAQHPMNPKKDEITKKVFARSCRELIVEGTRLDRASVTQNYLWEELEKVIKGRGITTLDEYLKIERRGRLMPFDHALREEVWRLHEAADQKLSEAGICTFADLRLAARNIARARGRPRYSAAIIDESQDLSLVSLQLVQALVNEPNAGDKPDGLFLTGDGAQRIYAGGFTLGQAGIDVRGNTAVLRLNYRNTRQIIEAAMAITGAQEVDDHGSRYQREEAENEAVRDGDKPMLIETLSFEDQITVIVDQIEHLFGGDSMDLGDIAVLAHDNPSVREAAELLNDAKVDNHVLRPNDSKPTDKITLCTFSRAKGLEFKVVFILQVSNGAPKDFPRPALPSATEAENLERLQLDTTLLYVAMTRARDGLFLLYTMRPSAILDGSLDYFQRERSHAVMERDGG